MKKLNEEDINHSGSEYGHFPNRIFHCFVLKGFNFLKISLPVYVLTLSLLENLTFKEYAILLVFALFPLYGFLYFHATGEYHTRKLVLFVWNKYSYKKIKQEVDKAIADLKNNVRDIESD